MNEKVAPNKTQTQNGSIQEVEKGYYPRAK